MEYPDDREDIEARLSKLTDELVDTRRLLGETSDTITGLYAQLRRQKVEALTTTGSRADDGKLQQQIAKAEDDERKLAQHAELLDSAVQWLHEQRLAAEPTEADRQAYYRQQAADSENRLAKALGQHLIATAKVSRVPVGLLDLNKLVFKLQQTDAYRRAEQATIEGEPR